MKNLFFAFALLCSSSLVAQFSFNANGTGIQTPNATASGDFSTAMGASTTASGNYSTAMGSSSTASGGYSTAMGIATTASGPISTAMGDFSTASGDFSTAMGASTTASGDFSTAMGASTTASGERSTAMGSVTTASGFVSTAMGRASVASGDFSTAMGVNTEASGETATATGQYTTASGKFSLSAGLYSNASGTTSVALGNNTIADGYGTLATGYFNTPNSNPQADTFTPNNTAFVIGNGTLENRSNAFEVLFDGSTTIAGTVTAPAFIGDGSQLTNMPLSFNPTSGNGIESATNTASGDFSTAMGNGVTASGPYSTAMGSVTQASGDGSTAMGASTTASGSYSTASGGATTAEDYLSFVIGVHNETDETPNPEIFSYQNTAFVIGNGGYDIEGSYVGTSDTFSNAFEVLFDGTTTIAGDLNINSDARLKANIISLGATLSKLLQIDGKTYTMKKDANHKKKIGLLAQDIEKVFPELVTETNDIKSVNYQGLVPVLINAMKEQQDEINSYKTELSNQRKEIDELKSMVEKLMLK
jgi:hypothetical protein